MDEDKKKEKIAKLQKNSPITRLHKKGYTIHPKGKDKNSNTQGKEKNTRSNGSIEGNSGANSTQIDIINLKKENGRRKEGDTVREASR